VAQFEVLPQSLNGAPQAYASSFSNLLGQLASADRPPVVQPLQVSNWPQGVANTLGQLPGQIMQAKQFAMQLPLQQQKIQTELQEQQLAQQRLKTLLNPGFDHNGKPLPDYTNVVTGLNGPNVSVSPLPISYGAGVQGTSGVTEDQTQQTQQTQGSQQNQQAAQPQVQSQTQLPTRYVTPFPRPAAPVQNTPTQPVWTPGASLSDSTVPNGTPTSQMPVDTAARLSSAMPPPSHVLDWYQKTIDSRATDARAEMTPDGQPTGRTVIIHDPKSGIADQPVHPLYFANAVQNGAWSPPEGTRPHATMPNTAMASGSPVSALSAAASAPVAQSISDRLAAGALSPQDVISQGGPLWAGGPTAPQAPLPAVPNGAAPQHLPTFGMTPQNVQQTGGMPPVVPSAPRALPLNGAAGPSPTPYPQMLPFGSEFTGHPAIGPATPENLQYWRDNYGGMSGADIAKLIQNPKNVSVVGPAEETPSNGIPSQKVIITTTTGDKYPGFVDSGGYPYTVRYKTPYMEDRVYSNGQDYKIDNVIGQAEDQKMMEDSMAAGTVSGNWQSLSRDAKVAAYKAAQALLTRPVNEDASKKEMALSNVLDRGNEFLNLVNKYATPDDPTASALRSLLSQKVTEGKNVLGPSLSYLTGGKWNPVGQGDQRVVNMQKTYQDFLNAADAAQSLVQPSKMPAGAKEAASVSSAIGEFGDPGLPQQVRAYMGSRAIDLIKQEDMMIGNHWRTNLNAIYSGNLVNHADYSPGSTAQNPFIVPQGKKAAQAYYEKLPVGAWFKDNGGNVVQKLPAQ
jgi:hypothetical protein